MRWPSDVDVDLPKREMVASALLAGFAFLVLGGLWIGLTRFLPTGLWRKVITSTLGVGFVGVFVWMLVRRMKRVLVSQLNFGAEAALALFNLAAMLVAFAAIYARYGMIDTTRDGAVSHDFLHALYYSVVTFTTLGYGDFQPQGVGRAMAALQAFTGYMILGMLASTGATMLQSRSERLEEALAEEHERGREDERELRE
ncbi:MAG TPA: potassium channel family protein [Sandaracinaceae bacterium LLY-WYZ-13_1]|nr:potassium channel family protein [Sandaracinaceae bacterium LLY-WYZ-13_1]